MNRRVIASWQRGWLPGDNVVPWNNQFFWKLLTNCFATIVSKNVKLEPKLCIAAVYGMELVNQHFPVFPEFYGLAEDDLFSIVSLPYCYLHGKCSTDLNSLVPPVQTFAVRIRHSFSEESNHSHFFRIEIIMRKFHTDSFSPENWNVVEQRFRKYYNLNIFKARISRYLSSLS